MLDVFALIVLTIMIASIVVAMIYLGGLPGKIAANRNHPQLDSVRVAGWVGIFAGGVFWPLALIWAFYSTPKSEKELRDRITALESELAKLKGGQA